MQMRITVVIGLVWLAGSAYGQGGEEFRPAHQRAVEDLHHLHRPIQLHSA